MSLDLTMTCPCCWHKKTLNITHNMTDMAEAVGIYEALWHSKGEVGDIIPLLDKAVFELTTRPEYYDTFNPANGYGDREGLIRFCSSVLKLARLNPHYTMESDR